MMQPPRPFGPSGPSREQVATIEKKVAQSPNSLLDWEKSWIQDQRRRRRMGRNLASADVDESELD
jgi:hypothetical protein